MRSDLLLEEEKIIELLEKHFGKNFFNHFGRLILIEGLDIKTAIWKCWNDLECGGQNG
jgi:hypothetical protein